MLSSIRPAEASNRQPLSHHELQGSCCVAELPDFPAEAEECFPAKHHLISLEIYQMWTLSLLFKMSHFLLDVNAGFKFTECVFSMRQGWNPPRSFWQITCQKKICPKTVLIMTAWMILTCSHLMKLFYSPASQRIVQQWSGSASVSVLLHLYCTEQMLKL